MENLNNNSNKDLNTEQLLEVLQQIDLRLLQMIEKLKTLKRQQEIAPVKGASLRALLSLEDIQDIFEISLTTSHRFVREKTFPARKIGSRYYFYEQDIHDALMKNFN